MLLLLFEFDDPTGSSADDLTAPVTPAAVAPLLLVCACASARLLDSLAVEASATECVAFVARVPVDDDANRSRTALTQKKVGGVRRPRPLHPPITTVRCRWTEQVVGVFVVADLPLSSSSSFRLS